MAIDLTDPYEDIARHIGHEIECVVYGDGANAAIECLDCGEVLLDADAEEGQ